MGSAVSYLSVDQKGRATLPGEVRAALGLRPSDFVLLEKTWRGTYELGPAALVPRDQLWFHHPEMQARIRKAEADVAGGRTKVTRTAAGAQALLDRPLLAYSLGKVRRMTKLERLIEEARELPTSDRLRLIEEVERSVEGETDGALAPGSSYGPLVALTGTAVSDFSDVSTDKYRHVADNSRRK